MTAKNYESLLKNTLKDYIVIKEGNGIKPGSIDFSVTITNHVFDASKIDGYDKDDDKFAGATKLDGQKVCYIRIAKIIDGVDKHVLYAGYRPIGKMKKETVVRMLLLDAIKQLMFAGLQYNDILYDHYLEQQKQGEDDEVKDQDS